VGFELKAGSALGIIGPSASGKSTLARALVGVWRPVRGNIRIDGADIAQWSEEFFRYHVGYLPQDVELFEGTIADNISRFSGEGSSEAIISAARQAGAHEMILGLVGGYDAQIGEAGCILSAGQRQRIGLARALYGDPFLVVLDEPNSSTDAQGDIAVQHAIKACRLRGAIVIVIAHRPSALGAVDQILVLDRGRAREFGPKEDILRKTLAAPA
jgi:ATP-binding cassette subfamily C protein